MRRSSSTAGFTLIELLVASSIFVLAITVITTAGTNFYQSYRRQVAKDMLYQETRALMDRLIQGVRENTIDYDEYFNHLAADQGGGGSTNEYGDYYRGYLHQFFFVSPPAQNSTPCPELGLNDPARYAYSETDPCRAQHVNEGIFNTRADNQNSNDTPQTSALGGSNLQPELYLMSSDGKKKTIWKLLPGADGISQAGILELELKDQYLNASIDSGSLTAGTDGYYDCWANAPDFPERNFIPISSPSITITSLKFFVSPIDDPRQAFNEADASVQAHPNVTIVLSAAIAPQEARKFYSEDDPPALTLETTVSSRLAQGVEIPFAVDGPNPSGMCLRSLPIPSGGSASSTLSASACGNGTKEAGEQCDGTDLGDQNCTNIAGGFTGGGLSCNSDCTLNASACVTGCVAVGSKCQVCHTSGGCNTLQISNSGRNGHLNHGDYDGACLSDDDATSPLCGR